MYIIIVEVMVMADLFEYLRWRGDIRFSQVGPAEVDLFILATLVYIRLDGIVPEDALEGVSLAMAQQLLEADPNKQQRFRTANDEALLKAAANAPRFRDVWLQCYRDVFIPQEDTQFAAVTCRLEDGSVAVVYRGTDKTMVGWKEDFEMAFRESVAAQRLAGEYLEEVAAWMAGPLRLCGHSKGGNVAIYAAANVPENIQSRILQVHNFDGPGFHETFLEQPGYLAILPKIVSIVPQASIIGMLLRRKEPLRFIRSSQLGLMQHEPYSWQVMAGQFVTEEDLSGDAKFWDRTFDKWIDETAPEDRAELFGAVFDFLMMEDVTQPKDLLKPQNLLQYIKNFKGDEGFKTLLRTELNNLVQSALSAQKDLSAEKSIDN